MRTQLQMICIAITTIIIYLIIFFSQIQLFHSLASMIVLYFQPKHHTRTSLHFQGKAFKNDLHSIPQCKIAFPPSWSILSQGMPQNHKSHGISHFKCLSHCIEFLSLITRNAGDFASLIHPNIYVLPSKHHEKNSRFSNCSCSGS